MDIPDGFRVAGSATRGDVERISTSLGVEVPEDLAAFLGATGGGEGFWGVGYLCILPPPEIVETTSSYRDEEMAEDLVVIGGNGGLETYAIDVATGRYVVTDLMDDPDSRIDAGGDLQAFLAFVHREGP